jgi:signal transduction histidine kinase
VAAAASALRPRLASQALPLVAVGSAIVAAVAVHRSIHAGTTYAGVSWAAHAADLAAGVGLLCAGLVAWFEAASRRLGGLALLAAALWFAPDWEGWDRGPSIVRSLGAAGAPLFLALLFHLLLAAPRGRVASRFARAAIVGGYAVVIVVAVGRALVREPLLDPYCWRNCLDNVFLLHADEGMARALDRSWLVAAASIGLLLFATCVWRLLAATDPARRVLAPLLVPGGLAGATQVAYAIALLRTPSEAPKSMEFLSLFFARSLAITALALGIAWTIGRIRLTRAAVARVAAELGEAPPAGKLRQALAAAVGDPTLEVAYWLPASRRYVGADGEVVEAPAPGDGRAVIPIVREGEPLALVAYDPALLDGSDLERELGSAARLAVENERLQAEVFAQLQDLRASRTRIVERGDTERRRLERDLHDGAQQRLLALSYDLRLAFAAAQQGGDRELTTLLNSATDEAQAALAELRELAHGIHPAILAEAGLAPALATLADEAPLPVELGELPPDRYAPAIETAAYLAIAEAIDDAARRNATFIVVEAARVADRLVVTARDDGAARESALVHLADRIGALGGFVDIGPPTLRAEIPCV